MPMKKSFLNLSNQINSKQVQFAEFERYLDCPVQRNHDKRAKEKKTREKLSNLQAQHCIVASAILTKNSYDEDTGVSHFANTNFLIDGHTRRKFWQLGYSNFVPEELTVLEFEVDSIEKLRDLYYTFDNATNTEKSADLAYGACRYLGIEVKNHKLYEVSGLTWAAHYFNNNLFPKTSGYNGHGLITIYDTFRDEIQFLDSFKWDTPFRIHGPLKTATLLFLKKNQNSEETKNIVKRVFTDDFYSKIDGKLDGVTHLLQWLKDKDSDFSQSYTTIPILTEKFLYWLNQAHLEATQGKERVSKKGNHSGVLDSYSFASTSLANVSTPITENLAS